MHKIKYYFPYFLFFILTPVIVQAQDSFIKKYGLGSTCLTSYTIDNYEDGSYLIAGLKVNNDTILYLFVGLVDDQGDILQYDSIPQVDYLILINLNNDFNLIGDSAYYYSNSQARTMFYRYDILENNLVPTDTLTLLEDYWLNSRDFISTGPTNYIIAGQEGMPGERQNIGLLKVDGDNRVFHTLDNPTGHNLIRRMYDNGDGTFDVLSMYNTPGISTVNVHTFNSDLVLLDSIIGDEDIFRAEFTDAIKDRIRTMYMAVGFMILRHKA